MQNRKSELPYNMNRNPNKPFIATDTKEPLVVMGGYKVNENGGLLHDIIANYGPPKATDKDIETLNEIGVEGIKAKAYYGVADRLKTSEYITPEQYLEIVSNFSKLI